MEAPLTVSCHNRHNRWGASTNLPTKYRELFGTDTRQRLVFAANGLRARVAYMIFEARPSSKVPSVFIEMNVS